MRLDGRRHHVPSHCRAVDFLATGIPLILWNDLQYKNFCSVNDMHPLLRPATLGQKVHIIVEMLRFMYAFV